jgi:hypothetical protein
VWMRILVPLEEWVERMRNSYGRPAICTACKHTGWRGRGRARAHR